MALNVGNLTGINQKHSFYSWFKPDHQTIREPHHGFAASWPYRIRLLILISIKIFLDHLCSLRSHLFVKGIFKVLSVITQQLCRLFTATPHKDCLFVACLMASRDWLSPFSPTAEDTLRTKLAAQPEPLSVPSELTQYSLRGSTSSSLVCISPLILFVGHSESLWERRPNV